VRAWQAGVPVLWAVVSCAALQAGEPQRGLGEWLGDDSGLPCYRYTGPLPFHAAMKDGRPARLPEDPFFLLGNHRLTLFVHASGRYQLLTGERAWARLNAGDAPYSGANEAAVEVEGRRHELIGPERAAAVRARKVFGVGFARFDYDVGDDVAITRTLSVRPSAGVRDGPSAFRVSVQLRNRGRRELKVAYEEAVRARFEPVFMEGAPERTLVSYSNTLARDDARRILRAEVRARAARPLGFGTEGGMSRLDGAPPALFLEALGGPDPRLVTHLLTRSDASGQDELVARYETQLLPGRETRFDVVIGHAHDAEFAAIDTLAGRLATSMEPPMPHAGGGGAISGSLFGAEWRRRLPAFADETDAELRREMVWNAAVLEAMATYKAYYDETIVPQGTVYDYMWGLTASSRDHAQHALPLCHTDPPLAKSVLRFLMKRMLPDGEVKLNDEGYGWSPHGPMLTSDQQLYFLMLLAEYVRATRDTSVLLEEVGYYPLERSARGSGLDRLEQAFVFLRDRIGVGHHGLMRLWNSDWNDAFYFWTTTVPYNEMFETAESHMNTAMAVVVLGDVATMLDGVAADPGFASRRAEIATLTDAVRAHRAALLEAFERDWGARPFPRRIYVRDEQAFGETEMWLEPQGFALQIPEIATERKRALFGEVDRRLIAGEALGARQIDRPTERPGWEAGSRENGGFWYALNGPLILGVATYDRAAAWALLKKMSFANYARHFPQYWAGQWSAADNIESSLLPSEGLPDQTWTFADAPVYCAHAHAWPLYCYLRLKEASAPAR
jgi:cellobiose phosphorylase